MTSTHRLAETAALFDELAASWRPEPSTEADYLDPARAEQLAATIDLPHTSRAGTALPFPWQWIYFQHWPATHTLGPDGHPREGAVLPPVPDRTRMFAGARMTMARPLILGQQASRTTTVTSVRHKHGRTGHLLFVTIAHEYAQAGNLCITEEQDIVYRSGSTTTSQRSHTDDLAAPRLSTLCSEPRFSSAALFRFSALTANSHRIHYDLPYAAEVEGYPALVVHGPLLATHMANLAGSDRTGLSHFDFRLKAPVFLGDKIRIEAHPGPDSAATSITVVSAHNTVHATATARR